MSYSDSVMGSWQFGYDVLDRLTSGSTTQAVSNGNLFYCWQYDSLGNRLLQEGSTQAFSSGCTAAPSSSVTINSASYDGNNHIKWSNASGTNLQPTYDASGNILNDGTNLYLYDPDGRICATQSLINGEMTGYLYDAGGNRVAKGTIQPVLVNNLPTLSCDPGANQFALTNQYLLGPGGEQMTELDGTGAWVHTNLTANGALFATFDVKGLHFHLDDWLGARRAQTNALGALEATYTSLPYGDGLVTTPSIDPTEQHFTGKERDTESGLDYFGARYYGSNMGRFMSPDWAAKAMPVPYAKLDNPQTLNLYAYVGNNPLSRMDKDGHYVCGGSKEQCGAIRDGLAAVKAADANLKAGTTGKAMLDKVLSFYGDEGKKNGVEINFKATDPGALGNTSTKNGITTISFGAHAFDDPKEPMTGVGKGETVAHEGTHGVDQKTHPMPQTFWQFYDTEYHAYQAESAVDKGSNRPNETDTYPAWNPGMSPQQRTTNITRDAYSNACLDVGGCH